MDTEVSLPNDKVPIFRQEDSALLNYRVLSPSFGILTQEAEQAITLVLSVLLFLLLIKI